MTRLHHHLGTGAGPRPRCRRRDLARFGAGLGVLAVSLLASAAPVDRRGERPLEGFGTTTGGGGNETAYVVTSLANDGPGTLRDALSESMRNITFAVGGTIVLTDEIRVTRHHLTLDGSTAPAPGITITGSGHSLLKFLSTAPDTAHDIILRHLRFTDGYDNLQIGKGAHNVVVDHCSFRRAADGNLDIYERAHDVTVQWCILADNHKNSLIRNGCHGISLHHNLYASGDERSPQVQDTCTVVDLVNNVVFDWDPEVDDWGGDPGYGTRIRGYSTANLIRNVYVPGERSDRARALILTGSTDVFVEGNRLPEEADSTGTTDSRWPAPPVTDMVPDLALAAVLEEAGAAPRDADDAGYVADVRSAVPVKKKSWGGLKGRFRD